MRFRSVLMSGLGEDGEESRVYSDEMKFTLNICDVLSHNKIKAVDLVLRAHVLFAQGFTCKPHFCMPSICVPSCKWTPGVRQEQMCREKETQHSTSLCHGSGLYFSNKVFTDSCIELGFYLSRNKREY